MFLSTFSFHGVTVSTIVSELLLILPPGLIQRFTDTFVLIRGCSRFLRKRGFSNVKVLICVRVIPSDWQRLSPRGPRLQHVGGSARPFVLLLAFYPHGGCSGFRGTVGEAVSNSFYGFAGLSSSRSFPRR